jgi:hypothetical protein
MSIRLIARDLYRLLKEVERLENEVRNSPAAKQTALLDRLRKLRAERDRLRNALEGSKDRKGHGPG